jgi:hypothetical protein
MYAPVSQAFKITMEQMALLEPALVETLSSSCLDLVREGMEEIISRGVPAEAARAFLLGHINTSLGSPMTARSRKGWGMCTRPLPP